MYLALYNALKQLLPNNNYIMIFEDMTYEKMIY